MTSGHSHPLTAANELDAGAAAPLKQQPRHLPTVNERQVLVRLECRIEVGRFHAVALAIADIDVMPAGAQHARAVEIAGSRIAQLNARLDEGGRRRAGIEGRGADDGERPALADQRAGDVGLILQLLEVGQHIVIGPAGAAVVGPVVVVARMTTDMHQRVEIAAAPGIRPRGSCTRRPFSAACGMLSCSQSTTVC